MKDFKNILVVRTDRIGDVVLTTPALKVLRRHFPRARVSVLVAPATRELIDGDPDVNAVLTDDRQGAHAGPGGFLKLVSALRAQRFDLAIIYHTKKRTNLACFLAGIPHRTGYRNDKFGFLLNDPIVDERHLGRRHEAQYCLDVLRHLGVSDDPAFRKSLQEMGEDVYVGVTPQAGEWVEAFCRREGIQPGQRLIAVHPGASDPSKCWPAQRFAEFIDRWSAQSGDKVILIGVAGVNETARQIAGCAHTPVYDATGATTVGQLAALLKRCQLLVSNDSGPVHVAAGVGTPVVSIFTRNQPGINPERWAPLGRAARVVSVAPNQDPSFKKAGHPDPKYLELIPTQQVLEAVDAIYKLC